MVRADEPRAWEAAQLVASICEALSSVSSTYTRHGDAFLQSWGIGGKRIRSLKLSSGSSRLAWVQATLCHKRERGIKEITGGKGLVHGTH